MAVMINSRTQSRHVSYFPVLADEVIAVGDPLWWDETNFGVKKASSFTWAVSDASTRRDIKRYFVGFALDAHRVGDPLTTLPVATEIECDATVIAATFEPGDMLGITGDAAAALLNSSLTKVQDPQEAIATVLRRYPTSNVTTARILGVASKMGPGILQAIGDETKWLTIPDASIAGGGDLVTLLPAFKLFGGAVELLDIIAVVAKVVTTKNLLITPKKGATSLATVTVVAADPLGTVYTTSLAADAARKYDANSTFSLAFVGVAGDPGAGAVNVGLRYRRLS